jgi:hypothetical protein
MVYKACPENNHDCPHYSTQSGCTKQETDKGSGTNQRRKNQRFRPYDDRLISGTDRPDRRFGASGPGLGSRVIEVPVTNMVPDGRGGFSQRPGRLKITNNKPFYGRYGPRRR